MERDNEVTAVYASAEQKQLREDRLDGPRSEASRKGDHRSESRRDIDRAIYVAPWRRLGAVTQIVTPPDGQPTFHTRLTHSEKVAQVARSIAARILLDTQNHAALCNLGGYSSEVCYAAGLLHDIGHPPFGHIGENTLRDFAKNQLKLPDAFEGNAQTMRIITTGKHLSHAHEGLDLTNATLAAVAKYPWPRSREHGHFRSTKWSYYDSEYPLHTTIRRWLPQSLGDDQQTLEASTMDTADDITYALHDLEDFLFAGRLHIPEIVEELSAYATKAEAGEQRAPELQDNTFTRLGKRLATQTPSPYSPPKFLTAVKAVRTWLSGFDSSPVSDLQDSRLGEFRHQFSQKVSHYIGEVSFSHVPLWHDGPHIGLDNDAWHEVQILKEITKKHIIKRTDIALLQRGQSQILEAICHDLERWRLEDAERLPRSLLNGLQISEAQLSGDLPAGRGLNHADRGGRPQRAILDYICTLSDNQCIALYKKLRGGDVHSGGISEVF